MNQEFIGDDAIVKTVRVPLAPGPAFELFTARIAEWWPLASHSVGADDAVSVAIEGRAGGTIVETLRDGSTSVWGTVTEWRPPQRLAFTWHPGGSPEQATDVTVSFDTDADADGCVLTLVHTGWAKRTDADAELHANYVTGWEYVLGRYAAAA